MIHIVFHLDHIHIVPSKINVKTWKDHRDVFYSVGKFCSIASNLTISLGGNH